LSKVMLTRYCFWFNRGNTEIEIEYPPGQGTLVVKAQAPGCYFDEYDFGVKLCSGICPQFYTFDKEAIQMLKGNDYQAVREWQRGGRKKSKKKGKLSEMGDDSEGDEQNDEN